MSPMRRFVPSLLVVAALAAAGPAPARAHPAPFSFVDVRIEAGTLDVTFVLHTWDVAHEFAIDRPELVLDPYILQPRADILTAIVGERLELTVDGRRVTLDDWSDPEPLADRQSVRVRGRRELDGSPGVVAVSAELFPYDPNHQTFLNVYEDGELATQAILGSGETDYEYFSGTRGQVRAGGAAEVRAFGGPPHPDRPGPPAVPLRPAAARRRRPPTAARG